VFCGVGKERRGLVGRVKGARCAGRWRGGLVGTILRSPKAWERVAAELALAVLAQNDALFVRCVARRLASVYISDDKQRTDFVKALRAVRPSPGGAAGRAGSSSRCSSRD
jgi:hypothetical protein